MYQEYIATKWMIQTIFSNNSIVCVDEWSHDVPILSHD